MTPASKKLSEELHKLAAGPKLGCSEYSSRPLSVVIESMNTEIPAPISEFLEQTSEYTAKTRGISVGIY